MRRTKPEPRVTNADVRYNSVSVSFFINRIMKRGKKSVATTIVYDALDIIKDKTSKNPIEVMDTALKNVGPIMEVRPRRVGGATYQVPMEVRVERRQTLGIRWLVLNSIKRGERTMKEKIAGEIMDAANNAGSSVKKKEDTHRMAEANKAFAHYRW